MLKTVALELQKAAGSRWKWSVLVASGDSSLGFMQQASAGTVSWVQSSFFVEHQMYQRGITNQLDKDLHSSIENRLWILVLYNTVLQPTVSIAIQRQSIPILQCFSSWETIHPNMGSKSLMINVKMNDKSPAFFPWQLIYLVAAHWWNPFSTAVAAWQWVVMVIGLVLSAPILQRSCRIQWIGLRENLSRKPWILPLWGFPVNVPFNQSLMNVVGDIPLWNPHLQPAVAELF